MITYQFAGWLSAQCSRNSGCFVSEARGRARAIQFYILFDWTLFLLHPPRWLCNRCCLSVCLLTTLRKNFRTDLHKIFREAWQWAIEQLVKFWWRFGSPSGDRDCFTDSSLLGDTESGINRLRCATLQCTACTSRHRHSNYDVIASPAGDRQRDWYRDTGKTCLTVGMLCPSASSISRVMFVILYYNESQNYTFWVEISLSQ